MLYKEKKFAYGNPFAQVSIGSGEQENQPYL